MKTDIKVNKNMASNDDIYRSLFDSNTDSLTLFRIDSEGYPEHFIEMNRATTEIFGYSEEEFLAMNIFDLEVVSEEKIKDRIKNIAFQGKINFETSIKNKAGNERNVEVIAILIQYTGSPAVMNITRDITERKDAEKALQKSQEQLQGIFNVANSGIAMIDNSGKFLLFNDWCFNLLGYTREEFQQLNTTAISHPDDLEQSNVLNKKIIDGEIDTYQIEKRYIRKDKSFVWCEVSASAIKDNDNNVINIIGIINDITERINSKKALEKSEARLLEAQALAKVGSWETDLSFTDANWSKEAEEIFGIYPKNTEFPLKAFLSIVHPEDRLELETVFVHSIKKHSLNVLEHRIITPTGIEKIIEERWKIERDPQGQPLRAIGTCQDITERKVAEALLLESKTRFSSIITSSPIALAVNDEHLNITYLNPAFVAMFGYTSEDMSTLDEWFPKAYPDPHYREKVANCWIKELEKVKQTGKAFIPIEVIIRCKNGADKTVMVSANPIMNSNNNEYLINFYDITDQKQAEHALENEKRRLAVILVGTGAGTWEWNIQTGETIFNEQWAKLIGYTLEELSPISLESWKKFTHPDDLKYSEEILEKHFQGHLDYYECEFRMKHKNGDWIWILDRGKLNEWDIDGKPLYMTGTHQDITDRKLAEEKLIASEAELRQTQIIANLGSFSLDFITQKWTSCTVLDTIFGIDKNFDRTVEGWISIIHPEWKTIMSDYLNEEVLQQKRNFNKEYKIITLDKKEERWVHTMGQLIFDSDKNPILLIGSVQDITERKNIEEKLKLSSEKFEELVNSTGGIVWEADAQTFNFTYVSDQAKRLLGFEIEEWYEDGFIAKHLHPDDKQKAIDYCFQQINKMKDGDFIFRFIAKNGEILWLRKIVNIVIEEGKPRRLRGVIFDVTQLKETNLLLSESEEKYRGLVENAPYGILIYVGETIAYINEETTKMLKAKNKEEIIGKSVFQFIPPDNRENIMQRMKEVVRDNNASEIIEEKFNTVDGIPFDVEIKAIPTLFEHQLAVQVIAHDITQRNQSALELNKINRVYALISQINNLIIRTRNRKELFQEICNISVDFGKFRMSWIRLLDDDNKMITAAFAGYEEGYFTENKVINPSEFYISEGRGPTGTAMRDGRTVICNDIANDPIMKPWRKEALDRGYYSMISIPLLVRKKKIGVFNLYSNEKNFFSSEEEISLLEKITLNIAFALESILTEKERKKNQEKIRQLSQAVEQSPVTIIITNLEGKIEYVNPKFVETTGYSLEEIIGQNPRILKSGHTSDEEYKELWQTITSGKEWHGEFKNKKKDGTLFWESATISPILNPQGKITHFIDIKEDITNRKIAEQELINAKLRAEESDRLKLVFLANMSHEIRTPMNGILGFTELLKLPHLTGEEQQEYIKIIEKSGRRMLNIINDIISISKVESGQLEISLSKTDINEQINYIHTFFKPEAQQKGIKLHITKVLPPEYQFIKTDKEKIYAILTNLVKNAIKFTNEGTIEFGCELKGENLECFVKDSGIGISNSQKSIVFERFRQANESISRSHEGSGLGLAISKAYIEMLGGKIWVESEEGKGSTFYFTIPFISDEKEQTVVEKVAVIIEPENKIKDLKVLIVEDDPISKLLISIAIKPYSKEILKVVNGNEAIITCRNNPDISGNDGYQYA